MTPEDITLLKNTILDSQTSVRREFQTAMTYGTSTDLRVGAPESHVDGVPIPYYCSDCNVWHLIYTGICFDVQDGELTVFTWHADEDGDWEYVPVGDLSCHKQELEQLYLDQAEAFREYREDGDGSLDHLI